MESVWPAMIGASQVMVTLGPLTSWLSKVAVLPPETVTAESTGHPVEPATAGISSKLMRTTAGGPTATTIVAAVASNVAAGGGFGGARMMPSPSWTMPPLTVV